MKCLSLRQPYAALVVAGIKTIECRTWPAPVRGTILIHAATKTLALHPEFWPLLKRVPEHLLTASGMVIGKVRVKDCRRLTLSDRAAALYGPDPSLYGWILEDAQELPLTPASGMQRLFEVVWPPPANNPSGKS